VVTLETSVIQAEPPIQGEIPAVTPVRKAAGILFLTPDNRVLLVKRKTGNYAGTWAFPGGWHEEGESIEECARREAAEEVGFTDDVSLTEWARKIGECDFTTFIAHVDYFKPTLQPEECDSYVWIDRRAAFDLPLHPGDVTPLQLFDLDELGIAKAMAAGELVSPQMYGNDLMLIDIRITGTGVSFRPAHDEYVMRDPSIYMNEKFLQRCNGLEVILHHPKNSLLNTEEFRSRIIGTVFVPYLRHAEQEVWAIAKIRDMEVAEILKTEPASTSPAVSVIGERVDVPDGRKILIEDRPMLLDHIAVLIGENNPGVWDKGKGMNGVESVSAEEQQQAPIDLVLRKLNLNEIVQRIP